MKDSDVGFILFPMDYESIQSYIEKIKQNSKSWPDGILIAKRKKSVIQYYYSECPKAKPVYLKKEDIDFAQSLAQRDYEKKILRVLEKNKKSAEAAERIKVSCDLKSVYSGFNDLKKPLITPIELPDSDFVSVWQSQKYIPNPYPFDANVKTTLRGEQVRSASEKLIADVLYINKIPYRYEAPIKLKGGRIVYPDFIVLNINKRKEYIWEHFGMVDHERYRIKALKKIDEYIDNGYFQGINMIATWEDENYQLKKWVVEQYIDYFLK